MLHQAIPTSDSRNKLFQTKQLHLSRRRRCKYRQLLGLPPRRNTKPGQLNAKGDILLRVRSPVAIVALRCQQPLVFPAFYCIDAPPNAPSQLGYQHGHRRRATRRPMLLRLCLLGSSRKISPASDFSRLELGRSPSACPASLVTRFEICGTALLLPKMSRCPFRVCSFTPFAWGEGVSARLMLNQKRYLAPRRSATLRWFMVISSLC
jgi:hypothetical protein